MKELILGLDPGSRFTGYGVIAVEGDHLEHISHGVIQINERWPLHERLKYLHAELEKIFSLFPVKTAAVEKIFFGKNADSAFKLGHARGICLLSAASRGVNVAEYAAKYVKKCVTGSGAADKQQVQMVIFNLLRIQPKELAFDATDALSLAVTHARVCEVNARLEKQNFGESKI